VETLTLALDVATELNLEELPVFAPDTSGITSDWVVVGTTGVVVVEVVVVGVGGERVVVEVDGERVVVEVDIMVVVEVVTGIVVVVEVVTGIVVVEVVVVLSWDTTFRSMGIW